MTPARTLVSSRLLDTLGILRDMVVIGCTGHPPRGTCLLASVNESVPRVGVLMYSSLELLSGDCCLVPVCVCVCCAFCKPPCCSLPSDWLLLLFVAVPSPPVFVVCRTGTFVWCTREAGWCILVPTVVLLCCAVVCTCARMGLRWLVLMLSMVGARVHKRLPAKAQRALSLCGSHMDVRSISGDLCRFSMMFVYKAGTYSTIMCHLK